MLFPVSSSLIFSSSLFSSLLWALVSGAAVPSYGPYGRCYALTAFVSHVKAEFSAITLSASLHYMFCACIIMCNVCIALLQGNHESNV